MVCINTITASLEGEVADWVMFLHEEGAPELGNIDNFMEELLALFGDPLQTHKAETEIQTIWQGARPVAKYIQEF